MAILFCASTASAQDGLSTLAQQKLNSEQQVRSMEQSWSAEEQEMLRTIEQLQQRRQTLQLDVTRLQRSLELKQSRLDFHERRKAETEKLRQGLQQWLHTVAATLRADIEADTPFLLAERRNRLESLDDVLADTTVAAAEKMRRLLEVLQVEAEYGYSTEVYQGDITLAGEPLHVDLVRLGRVSLFFIAPDARSCGVYDPSLQRFVALPDKYAADIKQAVKHINGQSTDALNLLPVGRIGL